ncbi:MAG: PEP-CTERM sorting domain-containing protein [Phycisphaeraceae bacterium]
MFKSFACTLAVSATALAAPMGTAAYADLLVYDGFAAGGETPGAGQYQSQPDSPNGTNNDSLIGQGPDALGFDSVDNWAGDVDDGDQVAGSVYPRINDAGLTWSDNSGHSLVTTAGALEIFRDGTGSSATIKGYDRNTDGTDAADLNGVMWASVLFQFTDGHPGAEVQLYQDSINRHHAFGFEGGNIIGGSEESGSMNTGAETFAAGQTHLMIVRLDDNADPDQRIMDIWVNPEDVTNLGTPNETFETLSWTSGFDISRIGLVGDTDGPNPSVIFDEFRFGTTSESVTPVPEPASIVLAGLGGLTLLGGRRRR